MPGWIELIESPALAVLGIGVAGCEVVFRHEARLEAEFGSGVTHHPVTGPGANAVGSQRSGLSGDLRTVVEIRRKLTYPAESDRLGIQVAPGSRLGREPRRKPPERIGLDHRFRNQLLDAPVEAVEVVPGGVMIERAVNRVDDRRSEGVQPVAVVANRRPHCVEAPRRVQPAHVADQPLLAEHQLLPSHAQPVGPFLRFADLHVRKAQVHCVLKRRSGRILVLPEHACVLTLRVELQPGCGFDKQVDAETV